MLLRDEYIVRQVVVTQPLGESVDVPNLLAHCLFIIFVGEYKADRLCGAVLSQTEGIATRQLLQFYFVNVHAKWHGQ